MNNDTTLTPADVREQVAKEVYVWEHVRRGAEESWARQRWQTETDGMRDLYFETADRILALLRIPRGDETADPTALRSDAQEGEADALDLIRWAESHHAALEPVAGNIMPPGTYACYAGDADDPYMGPGILGAIRAARRGSARGR